MTKLLSDNINNEKTDFSYLKNSKFLSDPNHCKEIATRNAKGSSFLEGINLPKAFFLTSYDLADNSKS